MKRILVMSLAISLTLSSPCMALLGLGDIVIDPTNLVQNTWTAFRSLESNVNEAKQIAQQIQSYAQDAKNFIALPGSYVDQVTSLFSQYNQLLNTGRGLAYSVTSSVNQFESLYASGFGGSQSMMERAKAMLSQVRDASRVATQVGSLFDKLCADQSSVATLLQAAQVAPGELAIGQTQAQLLGVLSGQQADLARMAATVGRVQISAAMRQAVAEETAAANSAAWVSGFGDGQFRGPGDGRGPSLPE